VPTTHTYAALVETQIRPSLKLSITNYTWTTAGLNPGLPHEQRERSATSYVQTFRLTAGLRTPRFFYRSPARGSRRAMSLRLLAPYAIKRTRWV
jgi:hypothetical protein